MSRLYEIMFLLPPSAEEAQGEDRLKLVEALVREADGEVVEITRIGRKRLAYDINRHDEAQYFVMRYRSNGSTNSEMERRLRLDTEVMRFLIVRMDVEMRYPEKRAKEREEQQVKRKAKGAAAPAPAPAASAPASAEVAS